MNHVLFTRASVTPEQRLLVLLLEGEYSVALKMLETEKIDVKRIEVFNAVAHDFGMPEKHYLLFELAKRGSTVLFKILVQDHGLSLTIFEDEKQRLLAEYQKGKELDERMKLPVIYDASSEHLATRSVYYSPLPKTLAGWIHESRSELRELVGKWLRINAEYQALDSVDGLSFDNEAFMKYEAELVEWAQGSFRLGHAWSKESREAEARKHQRSRPRLNLLFEKIKRRRALRAGMDEHKKTYEVLMAKYYGRKEIARFMSSRVPTGS